LPFERPLVELEERIQRAADETERQTLQAELDIERHAVFADLTAWQRVQLARHPLRPRLLDYTSRILDDLVELHGDRAVGDDPAMVTGIGRFQGQTLVIVGHQKGVTTDEKVQRNFGMAHPEGYRKALRAFKLAERLHLPVITLVDTPAAHPGIEAEQRGQGFAIAQNLLECLGLRTPVLSVVLSEGGSGGALAVAVADRVAMFEYAVYMICPPERCAEILWRDVEKKEQAAAAMKITARDLFEQGIVDRVIPEPPGGAHRNPDGAAAALAEEIARFLADAGHGDWSVERRQEKFRRMGVWQESAVGGD
jgi:acetyl-CoA carboxylase carboxyl transferase subunit alpha